VRHFFWSGENLSPSEEEGETCCSSHPSGATNLLDPEEHTTCCTLKLPSCDCTAHTEAVQRTASCTSWFTCCALVVLQLLFILCDESMRPLAISLASWFQASLTELSIYAASCAADHGHDHVPILYVITAFGILLLSRSTRVGFGTLVRTALSSLYSSLSRVAVCISPGSSYRLAYLLACSCLRHVCVVSMITASTAAYVFPNSQTSDRLDTVSNTCSGTNERESRCPVGDCAGQGTIMGGCWRDVDTLPYSADGKIFTSAPLQGAPGLHTSVVLMSSESPAVSSVPPECAKGLYRWYDALSLLSFGLSPVEGMLRIL
jgi:hypothetical protein